MECVAFCAVGEYGRQDEDCWLDLRLLPLCFLMLGLMPSGASIDGCSDVYPADVLRIMGASEL